MSNKLSRERKVFIGILGTALIGLCADRVLFSSGVTGPADAAAAAGEYAIDESLDDLVEGIDAEPAAIVQCTGNITATLAGQFEQYARQGSGEAAGLSDVFRPSDSWLPSIEAAGSRTPTITAADEFAMRHTLAAVMMSRSTPGAVVNKRLITIGQELDGFILVAVNERSVVFEGEGEQVVLELDPAAGTS